MRYVPLQSAIVGIRKNVPSPQESFILANEHGKRSVCSKEVVVLDTKHRYTKESIQNSDNVMTKRMGQGLLG